MLPIVRVTEEAKARSVIVHGPSLGLTRNYSSEMTGTVCECRIESCMLQPLASSSPFLTSCRSDTTYLIIYFVHLNSFLTCFGGKKAGVHFLTKERFNEKRLSDRIYSRNLESSTQFYLSDY